MIQKIKKGKHRCWPIWWNINLRDFTIKVKLNDTLWYIRDEKARLSTTSWNKLVGVSGLSNHYQSTRIAWRPGVFDFEVELAIYEYVDGKMDVIPIGYVTHKDELEFDFKKDSLIMRINGVETILILGQKVRRLFMQNFYFGGQAEAPHDMHIELTRSTA